MTTDPFADFAPALTRPTLPPTDISCLTEDTAVGRLLLAVTSAGGLLLCAYAADVASEDQWFNRLAAQVSPRILRHAKPLDGARRELAAYLTGQATRFTIRPDLRLATPFQRNVLTTLADRVGYGERTTYGELARAADHAGAARAVGTALGGNPLCIVLPCHRVLPASGAVGGYAGGAAAKEFLLTLESGAR